MRDKVFPVENWVVEAYHASVFFKFENAAFHHEVTTTAINCCIGMFSFSRITVTVQPLSEFHSRCHDNDHRVVALVAVAVVSASGRQSNCRRNWPICPAGVGLTRPTPLVMTLRSTSPCRRCSQTGEFLCRIVLSKQNGIPRRWNTLRSTIGPTSHALIT